MSRSGKAKRLRQVDQSGAYTCTAAHWCCRNSCQRSLVERKESAVAKAERITREEMGKLKWNEKTLEAKRKSDFGKIAIARRLRAETTMTHRWIVERLRMGTASHLLTHLLYWEKRKKTEAKSKANYQEQTPCVRDPLRTFTSSRLSFSLSRRELGW